MPRVDAAQLKGLIAACRDSAHSRSVLAVNADPEWHGPELVENGSQTFRVVEGRSPLAVREALLEHDNQPGPLLVILTQCSGVELGLDVRARLIKGDVLPLDPYAAVLALFGARVLDPELAAERWLIDDLIELAPSGGWTDVRPVGGVLDTDMAWRTWQQLRLGLDEPPSGIEEVLQLANRPALGAALAALSPERREQIARWWAAGRRGPLTVIVDLMAQGMDATQLVGLGLAVHALWIDDDDPEIGGRQAVARARLEERRLGRRRLDRAAADAWFAASVSSLTSGQVAPDASAWAESVLGEVDASDLAVLSDYLPSGFEQRLAKLGEALDRSDLDGAVMWLSYLAAHASSRREAHRLRMAEAAVQLLRRSVWGISRGEVSSFPGAAADYNGDGSWVEEARRLLCEGEQIRSLAKVYRDMVSKADEERSRTNAEFVRHLQDWSHSEPLTDPRIVPVEFVLDQIVVPVAEAAPVLMVVCDGLGLPVAHELLRDLMEGQWSPAVPDGRDGWPVGIAMLPTVTQISRASLLTGARQRGGQVEERKGFASHRGLRALSTPGRPPLLIHKAGLIAPSGTALPDEVQLKVADPHQRVVGVVVNSVDDHLARGDQIRVGWDLAAFRPLSWLLDAAAEAGRMIVLAADHGHVLQHPGSQVRQLPGGGERWRVPPPPPGDGEVPISGPRVLGVGGSVVLPADDRLRYGGYKHGYHGGATPEEVLVPVEVLARSLPAGWSHRPLAKPSWWIEPYEVGGTRLTEPPLVAASPGEGLADDQLTAKAAESGGWLDALLSSPTLQRQRERLPRPISDAQIVQYLHPIDANGGSLPLPALSSMTGEPTDTLRLRLRALQRLLNVDGTEVLAVRPDQNVVLNSDLAKMQFEVGDR